jgi:hypothetical protein
MIALESSGVNCVILRLVYLNGYHSSTRNSDHTKARVLRRDSSYIRYLSVSRGAFEFRASPNRADFPNASFSSAAVAYGQLVFQVCCSKC